MTRFSKLADRLDEVLERRAANAQPVADEREAFEAWAEVNYRHAEKYDIRDFALGLAAWQARAALAAPQTAAQRVPDAVWEAFQRMIEDGFRGGEASRDDARIVARHRDRYAFMLPAPKDVAEADRLLAAQTSRQHGGERNGEFI